LGSVIEGRARPRQADSVEKLRRSIGAPSGGITDADETSISIDFCQNRIVAGKNSPVYRLPDYSMINGDIHTFTKAARDQV
jgi:hypothetical protein